VRAYADNVVIELEPLESMSKGGLHIVDTSRKTKGSRYARVIASGPGHTNRFGKFVKNETKPGDRVLVDALAGQDYTADLSAPRQNKGATFDSMFGGRGEFRIVREEEIIAVVEDAQAAE
jgi:co-chaperonin GroES (HSP10)